jgi:cation diffusion facilitator family transporter
LSKLKTMKIVLSISVFVLALKFYAYIITGSNSILTDALESIVNVLASSFALYSVIYALKPKDEDHPYGHGKIEFLSAGFEGGMILLAGVAMIFKGISAFFTKEIVNNADIGVYFSAIAGLVNLFLAIFLKKQSQINQSEVLKAEATHLFSDAISSVGLILGLSIIYFTNLYWIDYVLTLILGIYIAYNGLKLTRESVFNLLDKADYSKLEDIVFLLQKNRREKWIDMHNLRVLKYGSHLHVDCHITLPWYETLEQTHDEVDMVEKLVKVNIDGDIEFFIHADPCLPHSCSICTLQSCEYRKQSFVKKLDWNLDNLLPDKKHSV